MKYFKRLTALALCAALTLTPALATYHTGLPVLREYPGFVDVAEGAWYYSSVKTCYEVKLMSGMSSTHFAPQSTLTVAECATVAAVMYSLIQDGSDIPERMGDQPWWYPSVTYMTNVATERNDQACLALLDVDAPDQTPISRYNFLLLLALVATDDMLTPINSISTLPDTDDPTVLAFYNAGILSGNDKYGTFAPSRTLTRAECAVMCALLARPELRAHTILADYSAYAAAGTTPATLFFPGVTAERYLSQVNDLIFRLEDACRAHGLTFNWYNTFGDQTFIDYVKEEALTELGVTQSMGTEAYRNFDVQVYYSRLVDLTGGL